MWVTNLQSAYNAYWGAKSRRDEQAAYHEILLFGGRDGYPSGSRWRIWAAQHLRRLALWVEASDVRSPRKTHQQPTNGQDGVS